MSTEISLRITAVKPPKEVAFALQGGKGDQWENVDVKVSKGRDLSFDFAVQVKKRPDGRPNFLGPFTQGPPAKRFVYLRVGKIAGQTDSPWERRVKIPLEGITWDMLQAAEAGKGKLEARYEATATDGGPACATRPLIDGGWQVS